MSAHGVRTRIRAAVGADADTLWRVHRASIRALCAGWYSDEEIAVWTGRLLPEGYRQAIDAHVMAVAERDGAVVGFGELDLARGEIVAVYVVPSAATTGVGTELLAHLEETARAAGLAQLTLCASLNAEAFYARRGWCAGAREKQPLTPGMAVDCVRMSRTLGA